MDKRLDFTLRHCGQYLRHHRVNHQTWIRCLSHGQDDETEIGSNDKELSPIYQVTFECSGQQALAMRGTEMGAGFR